MNSDSHTTVRTTMPAAARVATASRHRRLSLPSEILALRILLALVFLTMGAANLFGNEQAVRMFNEIGLGQWLRYLTGTLQILGGVFVLIPLFSGLGSLILTTLMVGASLFVAVGMPGNALVALVLLILSGASLVQTQIG